MPKKEHHNTTFTCQAQNTADRNYRSAKLRLEVKYSPKVRISVASGTLAGGRIAEGSEVRLSCRADANPDDLTYRWYINDEPAIGDYRTEMVSTITTTILPVTIIVNATPNLLIRFLYNFIHSYR